MAEAKYYLTKKGLEKLEQEYEHLLEFKKRKTTGEVPAIWHSEEVNPEYLAFQEDMSLLDAKLGEFEVILKNVELIKPPKKTEQQIIALGARVTIDFDGEIDEFTIVGTLEADPAQKKISNESPLGRGLLGAKEGAVVKVETAMVNHDCKILKVRYH